MFFFFSKLEYFVSKKLISWPKINLIMNADAYLYYMYLHINNNIIIIKFKCKIPLSSM